MAVKLIDLIPKAGKITDDISAALKSYRSKGRVKQYFQPHEVTINGQKYIIRANDFRASQAEQLEQGFKDLNKWKKDPTVRNWNNIFRTPSGTNTAFSKNIRSYITGEKSTGGLPLSSNTKKLFDKLKVKDLIGSETKIIKDYTSDYFKKLRPLAATEAAAEKALKASAADVKQLAPLFKTKTKRSLEEVTKKINPGYVKANEVDKADMLQQTSNKVAKYLQFLKGERKAGKLQQPKKTEEIINWIESESSDFRFQEGIIRDMKFTARDKALGLKAGTTRNQRAKVSQFADPGFAVDEAVGLSATYRNAPGYTEATQILSKDINDLKGVQIDRTFGKVLNEVVEGNTKNVKAYNKKAMQFMKDNPDVDVPIIKTGKNLDPKKFVSYFNEYSPQAQSKILNQAKTQNFVIQTKSKPVARLIKDLQQQQGKSYEEALAMVTTLGTGTVGGMALTSSDALSDTVSDDTTYVQVGYNLGGDTDFGDPDTWDMKVGDYLQTGATVAAAAPLTTKKGRSIYGKAAKTIAKLPLTVLTSPVLGNPLAVGGLTYLLRPEEGYDLSDPLTRVGFGTIGAFSKPMLTAATQTAQKIPASMPLTRKATEFAARGFLPARLAFGLARIATPLGLLSLAGEGAYQLYKAGQEQQAKIDAMTEEEKQNFLSEQELNALMGEAAEFAMGGRVGFKTGGKGDKRGIKGLEPTLPIDPNAPTDPSKRTFLEATGMGALGIGALLSGIVKFGPEAVQSAKNVIANAPKGTPEWFPSLVAKIKSLGKDATDQLATIEREKVTVLTNPKLDEAGNPMYVESLQKDGTVKKIFAKEDAYILRENANTGEISIAVNSPDIGVNNDFVDFNMRPKRIEGITDEGLPIIDDGEFTIAESRATGRVTGPDDVDIELDEYITNNLDDAASDWHSVEEFATGKTNKAAQTEKIKRKEIIENDPVGDIEDRGGTMDRYQDYFDEDAMKYGFND